MSQEPKETADNGAPAQPPPAKDVGLVIPTLNAGDYLERMVTALRSQSLSPARFLVIDSSSRDDTVAGFRAAGADVHIISADSFDHGATRQLAVEMLSDVEFIIFLTQDAIPADPDALANLLASFRDSGTGMAYGRQLPSPGAGPMGAHARLFNYPDRSHLRGIADVPQYGIKTIFCSNSFAAYRKTALLEAGGFPEGTIFGEDMLVGASLIQKGWRICYTAEAKVHHSHDYGLADEFRRYFDIGVLHGGRADLLGAFGRMGGEGLRFLRSEMKYLARHAVHVIPLALLHTLLKYGGYRLGRVSQHLPRALNRRLGMNRRYWTARDKQLAEAKPERNPARKGLA